MPKAKRSPTSAPASPSPFAPLIDGVKKYMIDAAKEKLYEKLKQLEKIGTEIALALLFFFIGVLFVLTALVFFLREQFHLSYSLSFLLVGLLTLLACFFVLTLLRNEKK